MEKLKPLLSILFVFYSFVSHSQYVGTISTSLCPPEYSGYVLTTQGWTSGDLVCAETENISGGTGQYTANFGWFEDEAGYSISPEANYFAVPASGTLSNGSTFKIVTHPTLSTDNVTLISDISALSGGNITDNGGDGIIARGVCWNTSPNPSISNNKTNDGTESGIYTSAITGLMSNTTYYVRAYATNVGITSYGEEYSFITDISAAGNTLNFDGTDDYVDIGAGPTVVKTVEFWVNPASTTEYFIDLNGSAYISSNSGVVSATGTTSRTIYIDGIESTTIVAGSWQHIAVTTATGINANNLDIGRLESQEEFEGTMDEVRLWSDVRTETEIRENLCQSMKGSEENLVAYYRMNESSGTNLPDISGNNNDGTLTNMEADYWVDSEAFTTWDGSEGSDWTDVDNWTDGVPGSTDNVGIPNEGTAPSISSSIIECNQLVVGSGVTLEFNYTGSHKIHGSAFVIGHSDIRNGNFLTVTKNLYILPLSTLDIDQGGQLTIGHKLDNWGTCTIKSDASGTGSLIVEGSVSGNNVTMQRYIAATTWGEWDEGWHFLSSTVASYPIQDNFTVATVADYDFFAWSEPHNQWINFKDGVDPTFAQANGSTNFELGHGYLAAYKDEGTKQFVGTINVEDVGITNLTITGTGNHRSWHLLGNPFTSALTWYTGWTTNDNISGTSKIWNEGNKSYSTLSAGNPIPATNGFMVQAVNGTGTLTIPKSKRVHSTTPFYKNSEYPIVKLKANNIDNPSSQESELRFNPESTMGWDIEFDSDFLPGYAPLFYSHINDEPMAVNCMPDVSETTSIPFTFLKNEGVNFSVEMYEMENMDMDVWLFDKKTNHDHNLSYNPVYYFTSEEGDVAERFVIYFSPLSISDIQLLEQINIFSSNNKVEIRSNKPIDATINIYNISGQLITSSQLNNENSTSIAIPNYKGAAIVSIITSGQTLTEKVIVW